LWTADMARRGGEQLCRSPGLARPGAIALLGAGIIVFTLAPIVAFEYWLMPRVLYPPAVGAAILVAAGFSAIGARARRSRMSLGGARAVIAILAAASFVLMAAAMVGVQEGYRRRARLDREALEELGRLAPNPAPSSVFVPAMVSFPELPASAE